MAPTLTTKRPRENGHTFTLTDKIIDDIKRGATYEYVIGGVAVSVVYEKDTEEEN